MVKYRVERATVQVSAPAYLCIREVYMGKKHIAGIALLAMLAIICSGAPTQASVITREVQFPSPVVTNHEATCLVSVKGVPTVGNAGEPLLPAYGMQVLLPQGEKVVGVSVAVTVEDEIALDLPIEWAQPQAPLSMVGPRMHVKGDESIYRGENPFPIERVVHVTTETYRGYNIAFLRVYPVTYLGVRQAVAYAPRLEVTIETAPDADLLMRSQGTLRVGVSGDTDAVRKIVGEGSAVSTYARERGPFRTLSALVEPEETYPYVIITHSTYMGFFEPLKAHRESRGLRTKIVHVGEINFNYSGADIQEEIRDFIRDAYLYWETEYVLLAADENVIPHRGFYAAAGGTEDNDIASDLYYAALDGTWNDDGDGYWGEPEEADLMPEVSVGRITFEDSLEATNFVNKLIKYESTPVVSQIKVGQMVGELLWTDPTWGADSKDEIKDGSSAHGYTTVGFPPSFTVHTLYDRDLDPDEWDKEDLIPLMNGGRHLINHLGHSDVTYGLRMVNSDVETRFTNDGVSNTYFILYTQGCYSGSFDNRNSGGGYGDDCLGEHFTFVEDAAVAFVGNTRYGWGAHSSTRGASQYYDRQFFDALFGEGITAIGKVNDDSKVDNIPYINLGPNRWVYYQLVLLGDPAMDIWTDTPGYVTLERPDVIYVSDNDVEMTVTDGTDPIEGARVSIFSDTTYSCGHTDENGVVYIDPIALEPGSLYVAVTAHNFYAFSDTVPVVDPAHAVVIIEDFTVDDDTSGGSLGNSNGKADAGETIETVITLKNVGQDSAFSVSAELGSSDEYIAVVDSIGSYGDIPPAGSATPGGPCTYQVSASAPDSHLVAFDLEITHSDTVLTKHLSTMISAPVLSITGITTEDSLYGNGDGCIGAGETIELMLTLSNRGSGDGEDVTVYLTEADPYVTIDQDSAYVALIAAGGEDDPLPPFVLTLTPDCPEFHRIDLGLDMHFASGRFATDSMAIYVGGSLEDDFENGTPGWTHTGFQDGYDDEWHLEDYRNHTSGGTYSWKFGGDSSLKYTNYGHGALVTPELCLGPSATFSFWHYIRAELQNGTYAWDGSIVEISTDGGETWDQITPVGGYPYLIYPNTSSPFDADTPCFAWTDDWTFVEFDLSAYEGRSRIRFRFGSDGYVNYEGWYLDDITITDDYASVDITEDMEGQPTRFALHGVSPNPVVSGGIIRFDVPRTARVSIQVFDVTGRTVDTIADSVFGPGRYSRNIDYGKTLGSGVYFMRMQAEEFSRTAKVIILK
jgi:hypothetical protein